LRLIVVAQFGADQTDVFRAVREIFHKRNTRIYKLEDADELAEEIRKTAKPIDPSLFAE
jgi:hypothetical protein